MSISSSTVWRLCVSFICWKGKSLVVSGVIKSFLVEGCCSVVYGFRDEFHKGNVLHKIFNRNTSRTNGLQVNNPWDCRPNGLFKLVVLNVSWALIDIDSWFFNSPLRPHRCLIDIPSFVKQKKDPHTLPQTSNTPPSLKRLIYFIWNPILKSDISWH